jgi:hypothetical protein
MRRIPPEVTAQLLAAIPMVPTTLKADLMSCLGLAISSDAARRLLSPAMLAVMVTGFRVCKPALAAFAVQYHSAPGDEALVDSLFEHKTDEPVFEFLVQIAGMPRFAKWIVPHLPVGAPASAPDLYRQLCSLLEFVPALAKLPEFYDALAFFIAREEPGVVLTVAKSCQLRPDLISASQMLSALTVALRSEARELQLLDLIDLAGELAALFDCPAFDTIFVGLERHLDNESQLVRREAFLAMKALAKGKRFSMNLIGKAAKYVASTLMPVRVAGLALIRDQIHAEQLDVEALVTEFCGSCDRLTEEVRLAGDVFIAACEQKPEIVQTIRNTIAKMTPT